jgi:hypothetical protein
MDQVLETMTTLTPARTGLDLLSADGSIIRLLPLQSITKLVEVQVSLAVETDGAAWRAIVRNLTGQVLKLVCCKI